LTRFVRSRFARLNFTSMCRLLARNLRPRLGLLTS
jgi:hypothetical protein